jgi:hypothetical protein
VPEGATATGANNVAIKLYPDPDGRVGRIEVSDRTGARIGSLTQGASGFTIRPGAGGRFTAAPLAISPQQAARDQGIVRQVHAAQSVGRQIVTQKHSAPAKSGQNCSRRQPGASARSAETTWPAEAAWPSEAARPAEAEWASETAPPA